MIEYKVEKFSDILEKFNRIKNPKHINPIGKEDIERAIAYVFEERRGLEILARERGIRMEDLRTPLNNQDSLVDSEVGGEYNSSTGYWTAALSDREIIDNAIRDMPRLSNQESLENIPEELWQEYLELMD